MLPRHVYVHVPFCARRCSYCDFAIAVRRQVPVDEYLVALGRELTLRWAPRLSAGSIWRAETLYFGGGTPSRLGADGVRRMADLVRTFVALDADAEVTLEANPEDVSPGAARAWLAAGITRVSLGIQSFDDTALSWMHRVHDADRARRAVGELRDAGIESLSIDLIFALPEELERSWERDLEQAIALAPPHVSLYGLTVEERTPLGHRRARGEVAEAPEERYERDFLLAHDAMTAAGLEHYEVSSFGRPGHHSRHNSSYWTHRAYAGLGPGAHELLGDVRRWNDGAYSAWVRALERGTDPVAGSETLTPENRLAEEVYLGLRTSRGLALREGEAGRLRRWLDAGWGTLDAAPPNEPSVLRLTPLGWLRLDSLAADLTHVRSRYYI